jgi:hypothetical protein
MNTEEIFHDIKELFETNHQAEANAYLTLGWRLLKVLSKRDEYEYAAYVLGWPSDAVPPRPADTFRGV